MSRVDLEISRRSFLKSGVALGGISALFGRARTAVASGLGRYGIKTPWYRRGEVTTTYGVCDMCPWRCGIVSHTP